MTEDADPPIRALDEANAGEAPSPFGELEVVVIGSPASVQSTKAVRTAYLEKIKAELSRYKFILTG